MSGTTEPSKLKSSRNSTTSVLLFCGFFKQISWSTRTFQRWQLNCFLLWLVFGVMIFKSKVVLARDERFLPFYALVRIPHQTCKSDTESTSGVCTSAKSCNHIGGEEGGSCAAGYGTCCIVKKYCHSGSPTTVHVNGTHLLNVSSIPNPSFCEYRFPKLKNVCQVRLDFEKFILAEPGKFTSICEADTLTFSGAANTRFFGPLCGDLSEQHVYLDYGSSSEIAMNIYTAENVGQQWDIKVTYIKCDSTELAPEGCLQYYTEQAGIVRSFNYNYMQQLNNEDYSVCVRAGSGMTKITWRSCGGFSDFFISGIPAFQPPDGLPPAGLNPVTGSDCTLDWVMVYGVDKYCGNTLENPVTSMTQPFMLQVHFDQMELPDDDSNVGFCLMLVMIPFFCAP